MYYVMYSTTQNNGYAVPQLYPKMSADKHSYVMTTWWRYKSRWTLTQVYIKFFSFINTQCMLILVL